MSEVDTVMSEEKNNEEVVVEDDWEDITENGDGGILKKVIKEGTGYQTAAKNSDVEVHYVGTLLDGKKFDSSRDRSETFKFKLGAGNVIKGWDIGVATMKKGEISTFKIRSDYAYGSKGTGSIPADATLIFEIELFNWVSEKDVTDNKDGGVVKKTIKDVEGWEQPNEGTKVVLNYIVRESFENTETELDKGEISFIVGDEETFEGLDLAAKKLKKDEVAVFKIRSDYVYNKAGNADRTRGPVVYPNSDVYLELQLKEMVKEKESYQLENSEKIEYATKKKEEGNRFYAQQKFSLANKRYQKALSYIQYGEWKEHQETVNALKVSCHSNAAAIHIKLKQYKKALEEVKKVLEIDSNNVKALYRKGVAEAGLGDYLESLRDLKKALSLDQTNREIIREIGLVEKKQREQDAKDQNLFSHMLKAL